jgi:hypothetical protein
MMWYVHPSILFFRFLDQILRCNVRLKIIDLGIRHAFIFIVVNALIRPFLARHIVFHEFTVRLVFEKEALFAVAVETEELSLVPFSLTLVESSFIY